MGALKGFVAALALALVVPASPAQASEAERWRGVAGEAADRFGLPVEWVMRVLDAESGGRTTLGGRPITSHAGAMGLMQLMPATWASLRTQYELGNDPHDPHDNIVAGTAYLRAMYDRFGYPGLFAAYNAGPGRYGEYLSRGRALPRETRDYIAKVAGVTGSARASRQNNARRDVADVLPFRDPIFMTVSSSPPLAADGPAVSAARAVTASTAPRAASAGPGDGLFLLRVGGGDDGE